MRLSGSLHNHKAMRLEALDNNQGGRMPKDSLPRRLAIEALVLHRRERTRINPIKIRTATDRGEAADLSDLYNS